MGGKPFVANPTGQVDLLWNPNQFAFLDALDLKTAGGRWSFNRLALMAGRRGGKTKIGGVACAKKASIPDSVGWVCAPTYKDLHDFVIPSVRAAIPQSFVRNWSEQHYELELVNHALIQFRSLDDPEKARGPGLDWAWIDEARKISERAWETMLPALTDKRGQAFITTSPNAFDWCYRKFWLPAQLGEPGYWACKYRTIDNPSIDPREIESARAGMDPLFFLQEFEADFVNFTGAVYNIESQILRTDDQVRAIIPEWPRINPERVTIVGLDPGADHPFAGVLILITELGLVVIGEYLARNKPMVDHRNGILGMLAQYSAVRPFQPERWAIDRSQKQAAIELSQFGIYATGAENSVVDGIRRVQSWLAAKQLWFIEARCPRTVEEMRGLRWAENTSPTGEARREQVIKIDDDIPDALRYAIMLWPELPKRDEHPSFLRRDISHLPGEAQWQIERMRRIAAKERGEDLAEDDDDLPGLLGPDEGPLGDFYGGDLYVD